MKYQLFRTKRFFIGLGIAIIIGGLLGSFVARKQKSIPVLFSYIPQTTDQIMINRASRNIGDNASSLAGIPDAVQAQFAQINVMVITQNQSASGQQMLFIEGNNDFDPQAFLKTITPETDNPYIYLRLENHLYLFASQERIQSYIKPSKNNSFFDQKDILTYLSVIKNNALSIISQTPNTSSIEEQIPFLQQAKYLIMGISSSKLSTKFVSYLVFRQPQEISLPGFTPSFKSYLKTSTIAYLEAGKGLGTLLSSGFQDTQPLLQNPFFSKLFAQNIALIISKGNNISNIGITLVAKDPSLFAVLQPLVPVLKERLTSFPLLSGSTMTTINTPNKAGYDILLPANNGLPSLGKIGRYLEQTPTETKVTLGDPIIEGSSTANLLFHKNTLLTLKVDMGKVIGLYKQFANMSSANISLLNQQQIFTQRDKKTLRANIVLGTKEIKLEGVVK